MRLLDYKPGELAEKLQKYLENDESYRKVFNYTKQRFEEDSNLTAHNWGHAYRDTINALVIGEAEGADMSIVLPAITMHDIGFLYGATGKTHGAVGAERVGQFLEEGGILYSAEDIDKIASCIKTHKGSMHGEQPETLEAKVVADADLLEKFGAFGVYQTIRTFAEFNWSLQDYLDRGQNVLTLTLSTAAGQRLAKSAQQFVVDFVKELQEANEPYEDKE